MTGNKLGKYEIQDRLGRGGMAEVYRAYHANLDRYVAIKVLHSFLADDEEFKERFEKEARNIARLKHPNIVQVYDFDYSPNHGSYYMVMELVTGPTLKDRLFDMEEKSGRLPIEETLRIIREAASALAYAHSQGMIHRDVKPANLMLDEDNRVVLTDFGIAKMLDSKQLTVSGGMIGTPAYMSPEQGLGEPGDERSDLYSLGVILYQLLTGALPYDAETALGVILMHVNDPIPDLSAFDGSIPESVRYIVKKTMTKDPKARYQTAAELIVDIEQAERGEPVGDGDVIPKEASVKGATETREETTPSPPKPVATERPTEPRRSGFPVWLGIVGVVVILALGYLLGASAGAFPAVAFLASQTPTTTPTVEPSPTEVVAVVETTVVPPTTEPPTTEPPTATITPTDTPTVTQTASTEPTETPSVIPSPTVQNSATPTPNLTQTAEIVQAATIDACNYDYAIVDQQPPDGEEGGFVEVNEPYLREITLLNTGDCEWGQNTSLTFLEGEDFNAGPRIFIRDSVGVGEEITIPFEGTTPLRGSLDPYTGVWQLRTRVQDPIGEPLEISVMVFDPGT